MRAMAEARGVSVAQVALALLLHQAARHERDRGAKRLDQLDDNIGATTVKLTTDDLAALDEVSAPAEYPGWMFERQGGYQSSMADAGRR